MKIFKLLFCTVVFSMMAAGCSTSGDGDNNNVPDPNPTYAMTWKMNGTQFNRNNTWGVNE